MNEYITFDGKRYAAPHPDFGPVRNKPATHRITLSGASDITYGPGTILEWSGQIIAPVTPRTGDWGDIDDLRASLFKREGLALTDHYGGAHIVYAEGPHNEQSISPQWDGASNQFRVSVRFIVDQGGDVLIPCDTIILASLVQASVSGGEVTVLCPSIILESSVEHAFPSRPIQMQSITVVGTLGNIAIEQVIVMDTLTLAGSVPAGSVV